MLTFACRICLGLSLVAVAGLHSAPAQDGSTPAEYVASEYDASLDLLAGDDGGYGACTCCVHDSCWTRPTLTGDWHGYRSCLQESGVTFAGRLTQFAFGIDGGINTPVPAPLGQGDTFEYTGRAEYDLIFDLEKFGGLPHGTLLVRAEHWWGEFGNVGLKSGAFLKTII